MDLDLAPLEGNVSSDGSGASYAISAAIKNWVDVEASVGGIKYSTKEFIGANGFVLVDDGGASAPVSAVTVSVHRLFPLPAVYPTTHTMHAILLPD